MISVYIFHERFTIEDFVELSRGSMDDKICSNADLWKKKSKTYEESASAAYTCKIHVKCLFKTLSFQKTSKTLKRPKEKRSFLRIVGVLCIYKHFHTLRATNTYQLNEAGIYALPLKAGQTVP